MAWDSMGLTSLGRTVSFDINGDSDGQAAQSMDGARLFGDQ
ncbi:MAG: hypothetical protein U0Y68_09745 [Blastocatellia bacterium]